MSFQGTDYDVEDTGTVVVTYNGAGTLSATVTNNSGSPVTVSSSVNLAALGGTAYIGFSAASAVGSSEEEITDFSLTLPEPSTMLLAIPALLLLGGRRRRQA